MIHRTYFTKDATLYSGTDYNSGGNPILKLIRGGGLLNDEVSRFVIDFNLDNITKIITDKGLDSNKVKHTLRIYNTMYYDRDSMGYRNLRPSELPSSFSIDIDIINQEWDEGRGYDYINKQSTDLSLTSTMGSTFKNAKTSTPWEDNFTFYKRINFDIGDENLEIDITDLCKSIIDGSLSIKGLRFRFTNELSRVYNVIEFFGKDTHSYFEPHIETSWDDYFSIEDNDYFEYGEDITNVFIPNINFIVTDINLLNEDREVVITTNNYDVYNDNIHIVTFPSENLEKGDYIIKWNLTHNGNDFTYEKGIEYESTINIDNNVNIFYNKKTNINEFILSLSGIMSNEKVKDNEIRKVVVTSKEYNKSDYILSPSLITMDVYIKHGNQKVYIISNEKLSKLDDIYFTYIDFSWFIPQEYAIDLNVHFDDSIKSYEKLTFSVLDSKKVNKINGI